MRGIGNWPRMAIIAAELTRLSERCERLEQVRAKADIAYSQMAFAVQDLALRRLSDEQISYRSERLARAADALFVALEVARAELGEGKG